MYEMVCSHLHFMSSPILNSVSSLMLPFHTRRAMLWISLQCQPCLMKASLKFMRLWFVQNLCEQTLSQGLQLQWIVDISGNDATFRNFHLIAALLARQIITCSHRASALRRELVSLLYSSQWWPSVPIHPTRFSVPTGSYFNILNGLLVRGRRRVR